PALDRVDLDHEVRRVAEHFLLVFQRVAVGGGGLAERHDDQTLGAVQQIALGGERSVRLRERGSGGRGEDPGRLLQEARRDDEPVDLVRPFVDPRDARVAIRALDGKLSRVAVAAEYLYGLIDGKRERLA